MNGVKAHVGGTMDTDSIWSNKMEFFVTTISSAVGMGNLWRFPYQCYKNGGGAFVIPLVLISMVLGFPLMSLELYLGQRSRAGPVSAWRKVCPLFEGIGWCSAALVSLAVPFYVNLMAYGFFYLFASFAVELPWESCGHVWNTPACVDAKLLKANLCQLRNGSLIENDCPTTHIGNSTKVGSIQGQINGSIANDTMKLVFSTDEYFHYKVLNISSGIEEVGEIQWHLALCLLLSFILIFASLGADIRSWGKFGYVTAILPCVVLLALLVRGLTEEGAIDGIRYFFKPDWSRLGKVHVWADAAVQAFFSLAVGWGSMIIAGSHNNFKNNFIWDAAAITVVDIFSSLLCGFVIFTVLGNMAHDLEISLDQVVGQGPGLVFIVYTQAVIKMPIPQLWAALFMLMLCSLALGSVIPAVAIIHATLTDTFPRVFKNKWRRTAGLGLICLTLYLFGLMFTSRGGIFLIQMFDIYSVQYPLLLISGAVTVVLTYVYGIKNISHDMHVMTGYTPPKMLQVCWFLIIPACIMCVIIFFVMEFHRMKYADYLFPVWSEVVGLCMTFAIMSPILVVAILKMASNGPSDKAFCMRLKELIKPSKDWGHCEDDTEETMQALNN